ncbi:MAG: hypothetical protein HUK02_00855, partial [Bacteroidaceae bacterium]|nr:hypothetical protein [Bacteroidaceae bacterium]
MTLIQKATLVLLTALMPLAAVAQQTLFRAGVEARFGYQRQYFGGETNDAGTGFRGDYA